MLFRSTRVAAQIAERFRDVDNANRLNQAKIHALELVQEHGGDFEGYRRRLLNAKSDREMELDRKAIDIEEREKKAKNGGGRANGGSQQVDESRGGGAVRSSVGEDLRRIDVTTPEGAEEFIRRERELKQKINALNRR